MEREERKTGEIEITVGMLDAGVEEIAGFSTYFEGPEDWVSRIFRAMICAAPEKQRVAFYEACSPESKNPR
jgi:hypothetical protein